MTMLTPNDVAKSLKTDIDNVIKLFKGGAIKGVLLADTDYRTTPDELKAFMTGGRNFVQNRFLRYKEVEQEFGIKKSALFRLKDQNSIEWCKPPGSCFLFSRESLEQLTKTHGKSSVLPPNSPPTVSIRRRTSKTLSANDSPGFRFLS